MFWVYSTHLQEIANFPGALGPLSLYVWARSGGCPWDETPTRHPVTLGTRAEIARRLGLSRSTVRRLWPAFSERFEEIDPGRYLPRPEAWKDPRDKCTREGSPVYVRIHPKALAALLDLFQKNPTKAAASAFRVACRLLPVLRAYGAALAPFPTSRVSQSLGMSKAATLAGRRLLVASGLAAFDISRGFVCAQPLGLLHLIPVADSRKAPRGSNVNGWGFKSAPPSIYIEDKGEIKAAPRARARRAAAPRRGACLDKKRISISKRLQAVKWSDDRPIFPGLSDRGALELAGYCEGPDDVDRWIRSEVLTLSDPATVNPSGLLLRLAQDQGSRPGVPSQWEAQKRRKMKGAHLCDPCTPPPWHRITHKAQDGAKDAPQKAPPQPPQAHRGRDIGEALGAHTTTRREQDKMNQDEAQAAYNEARDMAEDAHRARDWEGVKRAALYAMNMAGAWGFADIESLAFQLRVKAGKAYEKARVREKEEQDAEKGIPWIPDNDPENKNKMHKLHARLTRSIKME